ncbi:thioesterase family protein [Alkalilimnicola ehrlichii]|uniref:acyl-CoA thioesterase n=1 Tax=Alkalilimnicola ehrlichii TaxID=351052 RepID=UPI00216375E0|nr:hotdog domain-containing protein [Alkalilimnicola ehrlichii]
MAREDFRFLHPLRVRWVEVDAQGIVFNGHYLTYFDIAATEYFREIGIPYPSRLEEIGADLFVVHSAIDYHARPVSTTS